MGDNSKRRLIIILTRGNQRFEWTYAPQYADDVLKVIAEFAANPELDFGWLEAAMVSRKVREMAGITT